MFSTKKYCLLLLSLLFIWSCDEFSPDEMPISAGDTDFSELLILGDGFMGGYYNGGITTQSQSRSIAAILNQQVQLASNNNAFRQAKIPEGGDPGIVKLRRMQADTCGRLFVETSFTGDKELWKDNVADQGPFNDLTVPFLKVEEASNPQATCLNKKTPEENAFLNRLKVDEQSSYIDIVSQQVDALNPTFFLLALGQLDVMNYLVSGGGLVDSLSGDANVGLDIPLPELALSDTTEFRLNFDAIADQLIANGNTDGLVIKITDVLTYPYFTTLSAKYIAADTADIDTIRYMPDCELEYFDIWIKSDRNKDGIVDTVIANKTDLILLPATNAIGRYLPDGQRLGLTKKYPLLNAWVLDKNEKAKYKSILAKYNRSIDRAAKNRGLLTFKWEDYLEDLEGGVTYSGIPMNMRYITGGFFDVSGYRPNGRASIVLSNELIKVINEVYNARIPFADITAFP